MAVLSSRFGSTFPTLRLSVIEACNFRCSYCPPDGFHGRERPQPLAARKSRACCAASPRSGWSKLRLTGGEPSLRRDCPRSSRPRRRWAASNASP